MNTLAAKSLIEDIPIPIAFFDSSFCFTANSNKWLRIFNIIDDDVCGKLLDTVMPELANVLKPLLVDGISGKIPSPNDYKITFGDGRTEWINLKVYEAENTSFGLGKIGVVAEVVTESKRRQELLIKAKKVARIGGWELDLLTNTIYWTDTTKQIHEVPEDYVPDLEKGINFYKEGEDRDKITQLVSEAMYNGTSWDTELKIITAKGNELWVRAKGEAQMVNGKCVRLYGTFQDIDSQRRIEAQYNSINERLRIATGAAKIGIWEFDIQKKALIWDDNMYELYGIKKEDFSGVLDAWEGSVHPEDKERCNREVEMAVNGVKEFNTQFRVVWPNNQVKFIKAESIVVRNVDSEPLRMVGVNWDITELINTKRQLVESDQSLEGAFENSSIGMALVSLEGKFVKVNQSVCNSLGYTEKELLNLTFQDITYPDDLEIDLNLLNQVIAGKRKSYQIEKRYFHKEGNLVTVILTVTAVKKINGELSHFISQIVDISASIKAKKKAKKLLDVTNKQNESLLNFAHIVSHNLRSHSANLSMLTDLILNNKVKKQEQQGAMLMLREAANSLGETIFHLNEVVQVKTDINEKLQELNLYTSIGNVEKNITELFREKNVDYVNLIPPSQKIIAVSAYLESIVLNLFTNSIKYSDPSRRLNITISCNETNDFLIVLFKDNGLGINLEKYGKKLFGMYKTFHKHQDAKGIGLFITKNQIEAMGGRISVESEVGVGTCFSLFFKKP